jgi:hypothetical protein
MHSLAGTILALMLCMLMSACETSGRTGALAGAGVGALAGQAVGGDTESTLIGTGVGAGVGYIIGNEMDKQEADRISGGNPHGSSHDQVGPFGGTRWGIQSISPSTAMDEVDAKVIYFSPGGKLVTTTTYDDGRVQIDRENYRVAESTLIINRPDYVINADYELRGDRLTVTADNFTMVATRMD